MPKKFELTKEFRFEAAHRLLCHDGKCARLHGHSWVGRLHLEGDSLIVFGNKQGMLMDFGDVKAAIQPLLNEQLDHQFLNETLPLPNPTSEAVAEYIYQQLKPKLPLLAAVTIEETCTSSCCYRPGSEVAGE